MIYQRIKPSPALADVVESVWIQDNSAPAAARGPSRVVPTGTVEILFQYGDPIAHVQREGRVIMPRTYVTGQRSRPVLAVGTGRIGIVIVSLFPWGLRPLFPTGVDTTDGYVDLKMLDGGEAVARLEERLALAASAGERVRLVEAFLLRRRRDDVDAGMATAVRLLACDSQRHPLPETARALGMSQRHLARRFKASIGLQPGVFARIMRFQRALRMRRRLRAPWAAIAAACGFSDQAHLIHEVQTFAGQSPGRIDLYRSPRDGTFNGDGASSFFDTVYM